MAFQVSYLVCRNKADGIHYVVPAGGITPDWAEIVDGAPTYFEAVAKMQTLSQYMPKINRDDQNSNSNENL